MADPIKWVFRLFDEVSGPAERMSSALHGQSTASDHARTATDRLETATERLGKAHEKGAEHAEGFRHKLFETVEILHRGYEVAASFVEGGVRIAETFVEIGKEAIQAAAGAERSADSIRGLMGNTEGGEVLEYLEKIGKYTEFDDSDLRGLTIALADAGFEASELTKAIPAALDIAALRGGGMGNALGAVSVLERVKLSGAIDKRSLRRLGIEAKPFFTDLGAELGITAKKAQEKAAAGGVDPERLIQNLYRAISAKEGGPIGTLAIKGSQSLDALWKKIGRIKENLFEGLAEGKAIGQFKGFLGNILAVMDPSSEFGRSIVGALDSILGDTFRVIFGDLSGPDGAEKLRKAIGTVVESVHEMALSFQDAWPAIVEGAEKAWRVLGKIVSAAETVAKVLHYIPLALVEQAAIDVVGAKAKEGDEPRTLAEKIHDGNVETLRAVGVMGGPEESGFLDKVRFNRMIRTNGSFEGGMSEDTATQSRLPEAHDFLWRAGRGVALDPADTIVGAKGQAGDAVGSAFSGGGGGNRTLTVGDINVTVHSQATDAAEVAALAAEKAREAVYAVLEQFEQEAA